MQPFAAQEEECRIRLILAFWMYVINCINTPLAKTKQINKKKPQKTSRGTGAVSSSSQPQGHFGLALHFSH